MPPDVREWLSADDPVWLVIEIVERHLDTSAFHLSRRTGGAGRAGFDPDMLVVLLVWAWMNKVFSSREIERLCVRDVGFRVICGNDAPDHSTIARFRADSGAAMEEFFVQVLVLCGRLGLGKVGLVALDGTKIASPASAGANRTEEGLQKAAAAEAGRRREQQRVAREAARQAARAHADQDAAEDSAFGEGRGDVMDGGGSGGGGSGGRSRAERIADALADLAAERDQAAEQEAAAQARRAEAAERGRPGAGRPAAGEAVARAEEAVAAARAAMAERVDRFQRSGRGRHPCPRGIDTSAPVRQALDRLGRAREVEERSRLRRARRRDRGRVRNITDPQSRPQPLHTGGWLQGYNAQAVATDDGIVLATSVSHSQSDSTAFAPLMQAAEEAAIRMGAGPIGLMLADAGYLSVDNLTGSGPDRLIAVGRRLDLEAAAGGQAEQRPAPRSSHPAIAAMRTRLAEPDGIAAYRQRGRIIETVFGHGKHNWGFTRFTGIGLERARADWQFHTAVHNLSKIITRARREPGWLAV